MACAISQARIRFVAAGACTSTQAEGSGPVQLNAMDITRCPQFLSFLLARVAAELQRTQWTSRQRASRLKPPEIDWVGHHADELSGDLVFLGKPPFQRSINSYLLLDL